MKKLAPLREWPRAYPNLPMWISIIALAVAVAAPVIRGFLAKTI